MFDWYKATLALNDDYIFFCFFHKYGVKFTIYVAVLEMKSILVDCFVFTLRIEINQVYHLSSLRKSFLISFL